MVTARQRQLQRQGNLNSALLRDGLEDCLRDHGRWLQRAMDRLGLSARALLRTVRVARTIADLAGEPEVSEAALAEALTFRRITTARS